MAEPRKATAENLKGRLLVNLPSVNDYVMIHDAYYGIIQ